MSTADVTELVLSAALAPFGLVMLVRGWVPSWLRGRTHPRVRGLAAVLLSCATTCQWCTVHAVGPAAPLVVLVLGLGLAGVLALVAARSDVQVATPTWWRTHRQTV